MKTFAAFLLAAASLLAVDYNVEGDRWWAHIQFLASDNLEGRNPGSEGYRQAVQYVTGQFETLGLKPGGTSAYEQPVKFEARTLVEAESSLALTRGGKIETLQLAQPNPDAQLSSRGEAPELTASMVFVGYGLVIPEANVDNLAGLDLHGKVAVYVNAAGPATASPNLISHYSSAVERWAA